MNGGTTGLTAPFIRAITDPKLGFPSRWLWPMGKPVTFWKLECSSRRPTIERITATLSMTPAIRGSMLADLDAGQPGRDRLELAADAVGRVGLEVEGVLVRRPPDR